MLVITGDVNNISYTTAEATGMIVDLGEGDGADSYGHCYGVNSNLTTTGMKTTLGVPAGTGGFTSQLTGLLPATTYYLKAYLSSGQITVYGKEISFSTNATTSPVVTTSAVTDITTITASCGGNVLSDGGADITERGVCWDTGENPTILNSKTTDGTGTGGFSSSITGLQPDFTYYVRAYATNSTGTNYGDQLNFTTAPATVTDIDGNVYNTVTIGTQVWLVENLRVKHYNNNEVIETTVPAGLDISSETTPAYLWSFREARLEYNKNCLQPFINGGVGDYTFSQLADMSIITLEQKTDLETYAAKLLITDSNTKTIIILSAECAALPPSYDEVNGLFYTWDAVTDSRGVCPAGWHVATDADWTKLTGFLGGSSIAGGKLKDSDPSGWSSPNTDGSNETGFTALPSGYRSPDGTFLGMKNEGYWWTSTEQTSSLALCRNLMYNSGNIFAYGYDKKYAFSVRCLKDN